MERNSRTPCSLAHRATYLGAVAAIALFCFGPAAQASTERTSDVADPVAAHRPALMAVKSPTGGHRIVKRKKLKQTLVLNPPRLMVEGSPSPAGFGTLMPNYNQTIQRGGRDFRDAADLAADLSLFRFHLNPQWRLEWDFNRHSLPSERQTLGLNIGLYHEF